MMNHSVLNLYKYLLNSRILKFCIVGGSGVIVNMGMLYFLSGIFKIPYYVASIAAIELSILSNFLLNLLWTWKDRIDGGSIWHKMVRYHIGVAGTAYLFNYIILVGLTEWTGLHYLQSNLVGIAVGTISNYLISDRWTFKNSISTTDA